MLANSRLAPHSGGERNIRGPRNPLGAAPSECAARSRAPTWPFGRHRWCECHQLAGACVSAQCADRHVGARVTNAQQELCCNGIHVDHLAAAARHVKFPALLNSARRRAAGERHGGGRRSSMSTRACLVSLCCVAGANRTGRGLVLMRTPVGSLRVGPPPLATVSDDLVRASWG